MKKGKGRMKMLDWIAFWLVLIGGLVHLGQGFGFYFVEWLSRQIGFLLLGNILYMGIGASAIYTIYKLFIE